MHPSMQRPMQAVNWGGWMIILEHLNKHFPKHFFFQWWCLCLSPCTCPCCGPESDAGEISSWATSTALPTNNMLNITIAIATLISLFPPSIFPNFFFFFFVTLCFSVDFQVADIVIYRWKHFSQYSMEIKFPSYNFSFTIYVCKINHFWKDLSDFHEENHTKRLKYLFEC